MLKLLLVFMLVQWVHDVAGKPYHHLHQSHHHRHRHDFQKRDVSDYYGNDASSSNDASQAFSEMSQSQGPPNTEEHQRQVAETAERLSKVDQHDLDSAYQFVNNGRFDHGQYESPNPGNQVTPLDNQITAASSKSSIYTIPNEKGYSRYTNEANANYGDATSVNSNAYEKDADIGATNNDDTTNLSTDYGNAAYPDDDGSKKSDVPEEKTHIPPNATHPPGLHKHVTNDAIITHNNNDRNYSAVSRYPPYVNATGEPVYGPYPDQYNKTSSNAGQPSQQTPQNPSVTSNQNGATTSTGGQNFPSNPLLQVQSNINTENQNQKPIAPNPKLENSFGNKLAEQVTSMIENPMKVINQMIPDISQLTSPVSDVGNYQMPTLPKPDNQSSETNTSNNRQDDNSSRSENEQNSLPNKYAANPYEVAEKPRIGQVGGGADTNTQQSNSRKPMSAYQYPVTLVNMASGLESNLNSVENSSKANSKPSTATNKIQGLKEDDPRCKNYTVQICYQPWMQKHCPVMCPAGNKTSEKMKECQLPSYGGNSNGACCVIPFVWNGQPQYSCVYQPNQNYWCGTTSNYDQDKQWGQCGGCIQPPCPTVTPAPATTSGKPSTITTTVVTTTFPTAITLAQTTQRPTTTMARPCTTTTPPTCEEWSNWSECTATCGSGVQTRFRHCMKNCAVMIEKENRLCNTQPCPTASAKTTQTTSSTKQTIATTKTTAIPCTTTAAPSCEEWSNWNTCNVTCGSGVQTRFRHCVKNCAVIMETEHRLCNMRPCPIECSEWSDWGDCSAHCGFGQRQRFMDCVTGNEKIAYNESKECYLKDCEPVCNLWSNYSECSQSCGGGHQYHSRNCSVTDNIRTDIFDFTESRLCNTQPCPIEWSEWTTWSVCSVTVGQGTQFRSRNGSREDLGRILIFRQNQEKACVIECCKNCTEWSEFTECTQTCNGGQQYRQRECSTGGKHEVEYDNATCNDIPCEPPFCGEWSAFTECTASCDGGIMLRWRTCGGNYQEENVTCNEEACNGTTEWSKWSDCSSKSGNGHQYRTRNVTTVNEEVESRRCPSQGKIECSRWSEWSECSATCNGMQTRVRHCKNETHESDELQARPCNTTPCPAQCTQWSDWSECSATCGGGSQQRWRTCDNLQQEVETQVCNIQPCPVPKIPVSECLVAYLSFDRVDPVHKMIYDEGPYGNHASYDGAVDFLSHNFSCGNTAHIKENGEIFFNGTSFKNIPNQGITIATWIYSKSLLQRQSLFAARAKGSSVHNVNIELESGKVIWNSKDQATASDIFSVVGEAVVPDDDWSHLAVTYNASSGIAKIFINAVEVTSANTNGGNLPDNWSLLAGIASPVYNVHFLGFVDEFYIYNCSLTAEQIREVANTCRNNTGEGCPSPLLGVCPLCEDCVAPSKQIDGGYGPWISSEHCSVSCGGGRKERTRLCNQPEPQNDGLDCAQQPGLGSDRDTISCNEFPCPIHGKFCNWKKWGMCNVTCGTGMRTRSRECKCPAPDHGGKSCDKTNSVETDSCVMPACPIHGNFSNWSSWSKCSVSCGVGVKTRERKCDNPVPKYGGHDCKQLGANVETDDCVENYYCHNETWSNWSLWSQCSRSCGIGVRTRDRKCDSHPAKYGGSSCAGYSQESSSCKLSDCCSIPYKRIGCFKEGIPSSMPETLFTDRDPKSSLYSGKNVHGMDYQGYVTNLICRCANATKGKGFSHFSIKDFGQCLSGPNVASTYYTYGFEQNFTYPQAGCMDVDKGRCAKTSLTCVGMENTNFVYGLNAPPVDGNYTEWASWSNCSAVCGEGIQNGTMYRRRECNNPAPAFGGSNCSRIGPSEEIKTCSVNCPVNGNWSQWSKFGECSETCGVGSQMRQRACNNPSPSSGGLECVGNSSETQECDLLSCPQDCQWNIWKTWSECDVTCGNGTRSRERTYKLKAQYGGKECEGEFAEIGNCSTPVNCPIDCSYDQWSVWSDCSVSCGGGMKSRQRQSTGPEYGGRTCIQLGLGAPKEDMECNKLCCSVTGGYSEWTKWSSCSLTCGTGVRTRTRDCNNPTPECSGQACIGESFESGTCGTICEPVVWWSPWNPWSECSKSCGYGGKQSRQRVCIGKTSSETCYGDSDEERDCVTQTSCCGIPYIHLGCYNEAPTTQQLQQLQSAPLFSTTLFNENVQLNNWNDYLEQMVCKCAESSRDNGHAFFGIENLAKCLGGGKQESIVQHTTSENCVGVTKGTGLTRNNLDKCVNTAYPCAGLENTIYIYNLTVDARNGNYTEWSSWTECSASCGQGSKTRYRSCTHPSPAFGGKTCIEQGLGPDQETTMCVLKQCPVDCNFTEWSSWSDCSVTCDAGYQEKTRVVDTQAQFGGKNCTGEMRLTKSCFHTCPVNGSWGEWEQWGIWSASCGNVTRIRIRRCDNPPPSIGSCTGMATESDSAILPGCPEPGNWCEWSLWSRCSSACGLGSSSRTRQCECDAPKNGGEFCPGVAEECRECNTPGCAIDGKYSAWTEWTGCDKSCGNGTKTRSRTCNNPSPAFGGRTCVQQNLGESEEILFCNMGACSVDGNWGGWSFWSSCSLSCGEGRQLRERKCNNPDAENGGTACVGDAVEARLCKKEECCKNEYAAVGCFRKPQTTSQNFLITFQENAINDRWQNVLPTLLCDCATQSKNKNYKYFGVTNFGECYTSPDPATMANDKVEPKKCLSMTPILTLESQTVAYTDKRQTNVTSNPSNLTNIYEPCPNKSLQCAGTLSTVYVYSTDNVVQVDGGYSEWSAWGACSRTCGDGQRRAYRTCTNPYPSFGGNDCISLGESTKVENCNTRDCPVNGSWASWSSWLACSVTCGSGVIQRTRNCSDPAPSNGGSQCHGLDGGLSATQTQSILCNLTACPVPDTTSDEIFPWSEWNACSLTCGKGVRHRRRDCSNATAIGQACPCPKIESKVCDMYPCPIHGSWSQWTPYSQCPVTCGFGSITRTRKCDSPAPAYNGYPCAGPSEQVGSCQRPSCPVNGNYSQWSEWTQCSVSCNGGLHERVRYCTNPSRKNGGLSCVQQNLGNATEQESCNTQECPPPCTVTTWSMWSSCSVTCGYGIQNRVREPKPTGCPTTEVLTETKNCVKKCCSTEFKRIGCWQETGVSSPQISVLFDDSADAYANYSDWNTHIGQLVCKCATQAKENKFTHFALQNLGVCLSGNDLASLYDNATYYASSSNCVSRTTIPPTGNSFMPCDSYDPMCAGANQTSMFVYGLDNFTTVHCGYTEWAAWGACSKSCGGGLRFSQRNDSSPTEEFGGNPCTEKTERNTSCNTQPCPVNGTWGSWKPGGCSVTCGTGVQVFSRECDNPPPSNGGASCVGNATKTEPCNTNVNCPINGNWTIWTQWGACSVTCNGGQRSRNRTCTEPEHQYGGLPCVGVSAQVENCNTQPCLNPPCPWQQWGSCNATEGKRVRYRDCDKPPCEGELKQVEDCVIPPACTNTIDLGFLVDFSNSVKGYFTDFTLPFIKETALSFDVSSNQTHIAYLPFSTVAATNLPLQWFANDEIKQIQTFDKDIQKAYVDKVVVEEPPNSQYVLGSSYIHRALKSAGDEMFVTKNGMRDGVPKILIFISDFEATPVFYGEPDIKNVSDSLKEKGVDIVTVAVGSNPNMENLNTIASSSSYILKAPNYPAIKTLMDSVLNISCAAHWSNWGSWTSCSATCGDGKKERTRQCNGGKLGEGLCIPASAAVEEEDCNLGPCAEQKEPCYASIDLGFIVDFSGSVSSAKDEQSVKDFVIGVGMLFDIAALATHFAYIPFSTLPGNYSADQWFNSPTVAKIKSGDKAAQQQYLKDIVIADPENPNYPRGKSFTIRAMKLANEQMWSTDYGMRNDKGKVMIILSDGQENTLLNYTTFLSENSLPTLAEIKKKGVEVFAVAVGNNVNWETVNQYASKPENIFNISDYDALKGKMNGIVTALCKSSTKPVVGASPSVGASPTFEASQTTDTNETTDTNLTPDTNLRSDTNLTSDSNQTLPEEIVSQEPYFCSRTIDVVFLVDGSKSMAPFWNEVKTFLKNITARFHIGTQQTRIAVVLYSTTAINEIDLKSGTNKEVVDMLIDGMVPLNGGTRIDRALRYIPQKVLTPDHGDRQEISDVLVVMTDGQSDQGSEPLEVAVKPIKDNGVHVITVGLGNATSEDELIKVASNVEAMFVVDKIGGVVQYINDLVKGICEGHEIERAKRRVCEPSMVYSFDVTCGSKVYDESRKGNDATVSGSYTIDELTNKCRSKLTLSENGVLAMDGSKIRTKPIDAITIATWLTLYGDGKIHPVFSVLNSKGQGQYLLEVRPEGSIHFSIKFGDKVVMEMTSIGGLFSFNEWIHVAVSYSLHQNEGKFYINGQLVEASKIALSREREAAILPGDWNGFVGIGKEKLESNEKQFIGGVDEFYLYSCALNRNDIFELKDFCSRHEPEDRPYAGTSYEIFARPASTEAKDLKTELAVKTAVATKTLDLFEAPAFDNTSDTAIGTGQFAAKLTGYFIPPITAEYTMKLRAKTQGALFMNTDEPSIESETMLVTSTSKSNDGKLVSQETQMRLTAGVAYYVEMYQLSKEKRSQLLLGFEVKCKKASVLAESPITNINSVHKIPRNCSEVRANLKNPIDDEYLLKVQSKCQSLSIFCAGMQSNNHTHSNLEYVTLNAGPEENFAKFYRPRLRNYNTCSGEEDPTPSESENYWGQTWFKRVRINPFNMIVARDDYTYTYQLGHSLRYGSAGDCYSKSSEDCRKGQFKINLNGTNMKIVGEPKWVAAGTPHDMKERITKFSNSDDWTVVSAHCGGSCSKCEPRSHIRLQPEICTRDSQTQTQLKKTKVNGSKKQKKSTWSWIW